MKIRIALKDPDGVYDSIADAARDSVDGMTFMDDDEKETFLEKRHGNLSNACRKFIEYGEYVTIEIDTETGTAEVIPV